MVRYNPSRHTIQGLSRYDLPSCFSKLPSDSRSGPVDFDTGSSDLFLPSSKCRLNCEGHRRYDPSSTSTSKHLGKDFSLLYGDGSMSNVTEYSDVVQVAGLTVWSASFLSPSSADVGHHRLTTRHSELQSSILQALISPTSRQMA